VKLKKFEEDKKIMYSRLKEFSDKIKQYGLYV